MWVDAHDLIDMSRKKEIDALAPYNYDASTDTYESDTTVQCVICGDQVQGVTRGAKVCSSNDCGEYRRAVYHDNTPARNRAREAYRKLKAGATYKEIHEEGYLQSEMSVKSVLDKFAVGEAKRQALYKRVGEKRVANGLPRKVPPSVKYQKRKPILPVYK